MRKILLGCLLGFTALTAHAENWKFLGSSEATGIRDSIDMDTIKAQGVMRQYWINREYDTVHYANDGRSFNHSKILNRVNCQTAEMGVKQVVDIDEQGHIVSSVNAQTINYEVVVPGSVGEYTVNFVCKTPNKKPLHKQRHERYF